MKERMIPVTCPHCGHVFEIKTHLIKQDIDIINVK